MIGKEEELCCHKTDSSPSQVNYRPLFCVRHETQNSETWGRSESSGSGIFVQCLCRDFMPLHVGALQRRPLIAIAQRGAAHCERGGGTIVQIL